MKSTALIVCALGLAAGSAVFAAVEGDLPVRVLSSAEAAALPGKPGVVMPAVTGTPDFKTAAAVSASAYSQTDASKVSRGLGATSAVYAGVGLPVPGQPAAAPAPPLPSGNQIFNFKQSGDSVQAWATMTGLGVPYVKVHGYGRFTGNADASWRASLSLPGGGSWKVYVTFAVPPVNVAGVYEQNGPSKYRSRARGEMLLNGHPVWFTEAVRFNSTLAGPDDSGACVGYKTEQARHLRQFGAGLTFPGMSSPAGGGPGYIDSFGFGATADASALQPVTLLAGTFTAGELLDLQFVLHAEANVEGRCCKKLNPDTNKDELFCTGADASIDYKAEYMPKFYLEPSN